MHFADGDEDVYFARFARFAKILLKHGANPNSKHCNGRTPLHNNCLSMTAHITRLNILIKNKADVRIADMNGLTPLHLIVGECFDWNMVEELIDADADPDAADSLGRTPLHHIMVRDYKGQDGDSEDF